VGRVVNVGIIGYSEGNGHPYSFSAIINGYNREAFKTVGWPNIFEYLERRDPTDFGIPNMRVTCVWTQQLEESRKIAAATNIGHICCSIEEMVGLVDAVIIARDDWKSHADIARKFLKAGKSVFIDKPLSLDLDELRELNQYIEKGKLMSCAALRYAIELDPYRENCEKERPKYISGTILSDWERYGVHLLDGIFSGVDFNVVSVLSMGAEVRTTILNCNDGSVISITCLGKTAKTFNISTYSMATRASYEINDNFTAFKRTLSQFKQMIVSGAPPVSPQLLINIMKTLIAGNFSMQEKREVYIDEIKI
jgi:hypothetical protein